MQVQRIISAEAGAEEVAQKVMEAQLIELATDVDYVEGYTNGHAVVMAEMLFPFMIKSSPRT